MSDIQIIVYTCFAALPVAGCFIITLFFLLSSLSMIDYKWGEWYLRRPLLNSIFSSPLRWLRNLIERPFNNIDRFVEQLEFKQMERALYDAQDTVDKKSAKKAASNFEKISILLDYFVCFAGELVLLLILFFAMEWLVPELSVAFKNTFDGLLEHIIGSDMLSVISSFGVIIKAVWDFLAQSLEMIDLLSWKWWLFIIIALITSAPIRVWQIDSNAVTLANFLPTIWSVIKHYFSTFLSTFFSIQAILAIVTLLIGTIPIVNMEEISSYMIHISIYFAGIYMVAVLTQFFIYVADFIIGILTLPLRMFFAFLN